MSRRVVILFAINVDDRYTVNYFYLPNHTHKCELYCYTNNSYEADNYMTENI